MDFARVDYRPDWVRPDAAASGINRTIAQQADDRIGTGARKHRKRRKKKAAAGHASYHPDLNSSYLADHAFDTSRDRFVMLDDHRVIELRQQLDVMNRDYEDRERHGILSLDDQFRHSQQMSEFSKSIYHSVQNFQLGRERRSLMKAAERTGITQEKPVVFAVGAAAIATGTPWQFDLYQDWKVYGRTNFRDGKGQLRLATPMLDTTFDISARSDESAYIASPLDAFGYEERYKVSLSRALNFWNLSSGVSYGTTTAAMSASVSRPLFPSLTAVVDTVVPMDPANSQVKTTGEDFKLLYGISF